MTTKAISQQQAFQMAGELVMEALIADQKVEFFMILEHPGLKIRSEAKRLRIINQVQVALAGLRAVWMWVEHPPDEMITQVEAEVYTSLSQLTGETRVQDDLYTQAQEVNVEILAPHRHAVEIVAMALMERGQLPATEIQAIIRAAFDEEERHTALAIAAQAVTARALGAHLAGIGANPEEREHGTGYCAYSFAKSAGLKNALTIRHELLPNLDPSDRLHRHVQAVFRTGRELIRGRVSREEYLACAIAWRNASTHFTSGLNVVHRTEHRQVIRNRLAVHEADTVAQSMAFGKEIADENNGTQQMLLVSDVAKDVTEGLALIAESRQRAEGVLKTNWHAVLELTEILQHTRRICEDNADELVDHLIRKHERAPSC